MAERNAECSNATFFLCFLLYTVRQRSFGPQSFGKKTNINHTQHSSKCSKRKLDISNNDKNDRDDDPQRKKRKLNVFGSNQQMQNERDKYKKQSDLYWKGMNSYKQKYFELLSFVKKSVQIITDAQMNKMITNDINTNHKMDIDLKLETMPKIQIHKFDIKLPPMKTDKTRNEKNEKNIVIPSAKDAIWENTHTFAVMCHICNESFADENEYISHLKKHYNSAPFNGSWLHCEFEQCNKHIPGTLPFVAHIASHTKRRMYHCKVLTNGQKCAHSTGYAHNLQRHINDAHYNKECIVACAKGYRMTKSEKLRVGKTNVTEDSGSEWSDCCLVSVDCQFCGKYFDDFKAYMVHLKSEFDNDLEKEWLKCNEMNCDSTKKFEKNAFIAHLTKHGHQKPFHCDLYLNKARNQTIKCKFSASTKSNMTSHLDMVHKTSFKRKLKTKKVNK